MPHITVKDSTKRMIQAAGDFVNFERCSLMDGDTWAIPMSQETIDRLQKHQLAGETLDDTVVRLLSGRPN